MGAAKKSSLLTKKKASSSKSSLDVVESKKDIKIQVDEFVQLKKQIKALEAQLQLSKSQLESFARFEFAARANSGVTKNFKIQGNDELVSWISTNSSSLISEEMYEKLCEKHGDSVIDDLVHLDVSTAKIDSEVYQKHQSKIEAAIKKLSKEIGEDIFLSASFKVQSDVLSKLSSHAKSASEIAELAEDLKIKAYLKV